MIAYKQTLLLSLAAVLAGCGGGGSDGTTSSSLPVGKLDNAALAASAVTDTATGTTINDGATTPSGSASAVKTSATARKLDGSWTKVADEGGYFTLAGESVVQYGSDPTYISKTLAGENYCGNALFGDPTPNVVKSCYVQSGTPAGAAGPGGATAKVVAEENGWFDLSTPTVVSYGAGGQWLQATVSGSINCSNVFFGSDPAPNVIKSCIVGEAGNAAPDTGGTPSTPAPTPPVVTAPIAGDVVDGAGNVNAEAYRAMASVMSKEAGIAYRYGPDAASLGLTDAGLPTLYKRNDNVVADPPSVWQIGSKVGDPGPYSNNQANVIWAADNPALHVGVSDIQVTGYQYNTFAQSPQLPWQIAASPGGGITGLTAMAYRAAGLVSGDPVAIGRCGGRPGFCSTSLVAYQNGVIAVSGSNTSSSNRTSVKLPANKVPTGIAMTNTSEYAFVTVWDTSALKGQLAVVALAGLCDGCNAFDRNNPPWYDWWHEWMGVYPGLPNMGNFGFMKILGYVDLPGMAAPTEVTVTTGFDPFHSLKTNGEFIGNTTDLHNPSNRESFNGNGVNAGKIARGGVAVVVSKSEKKAIFVDLKPLFTYFNGFYFGSSQGEFDAAMANLGQADGQWPYAFSQKPEAMPTVIKTVTFDSPVTAVRATSHASPARSWIATQDGTVRLFSLGGYADGTSANAADIAEKGSVYAGRNPTSIAISKSDPDPDGTSLDTRNQVLVAARGDRKVAWLRASPDGNTAAVVRTVQDTRMIDPIAVEDADNFATQVNTMSVTDYNGKKVSNYRFGPVIFTGGGSCPPPGGCPVIPTAGVNAEFGGSLELPGKPFQMSTSNVP